MLTIFFLIAATLPKRTRPPRTPTASINTLPSVISGSIIIPCIIIASIFATVFFFLHQKRTNNGSVDVIIPDPEQESQLILHDEEENEKENEAKEQKIVCQKLGDEEDIYVHKGDDGNMDDTEEL